MFGIDGYAAGGLMPRGQEDSIWDKTVPAGLLRSPIAGRTDHIPLKPEADSYVIPADVVSGLGQGNTDAGGKILDDVFSQFGATGAMGMGGDAVEVRARGGKSRVPILAAGGEYVVTPERVAAIGGGDVRAGHKILDDLVKQIRRGTIKEMKNLKGPVK